MRFPIPVFVLLCGLSAPAAASANEGDGEADPAAPVAATPEKPADPEERPEEAAAVDPEEFQADRGLPPPAPIDPRLTDPDAPVLRSEGRFLAGELEGSSRPAVPSPAQLLAVPMGCFVVGGASYMGLAAHTGDAATPALQMGAAYSAGFGGALVTGLALYAVDRDLFRPGTGDRVLPAMVIGVATPLAAGAGAFFASEALEGRAENRGEVLAAAMAGAAVGELLWALPAWKLKTPSATVPMMLAFLPVASGAAIGARLARGPSGRDSPLVRTPVTLVFRF